MFLVEIDVTLGMGRRLDDEAVTDLIEFIVDDLDRLALEPSVGALRVADDLRLTVGVTVDRDEEFEALGAAVAAVKSSFQGAGIGTAGLVVPRQLRSRVEPLQPA